MTKSALEAALSALAFPSLEDESAILSFDEARAVVAELHRLRALSSERDEMVEALRPFVARAEQPGFEKAADDEPVTFFVKDVRDAMRAISKPQEGGER